MSAVTAAPAPEKEDASLRTWLAMFGCMLGALMSVLDIQVTNASLPQIEGGIGTGEANGTWISTAYLIGEIIMIPLADYLSRVFGFRRLLLGSTVMFLVFSVSCAFATSIDQMIFMRGFQGFSAGAMIPLALTFVLSQLPRRQQPIGMAVFAMTATFGPAFGPTLGGYLTTHFDWRYVFFINLVPGALMLSLLYPTLKPEKMRLSLLKEGDWWGIAFLIVGLASLQTMLDEGNRYNWFGSSYIVQLALVAGISLTIFVIIELVVEKPVVHLRLLGYYNFTLGTIANIIVGVTLYGSIYVLPTYLGEVQGYSSQQVGMVMAWAGIPQLFIIPFLPLLQKYVDARLLIGIGLLIFASSCFMDIWLTADFGGEQLRQSNIVRAIGQAVVMAPLTLIALYGLPKELSGQASGLFNMMRNIGGAVGTAMLATIITKRTDYHANIIGESATSTNPTALEMLKQMQAYFLERATTDADLAYRKAQVLLGQIVEKQALIMGYSDAFFVMGILLLIAIVAVAFTRAPN